MKSFIVWNDQLSVGIEEIDEQHKILIRLINRMHEAIHQRRGSDVVESILAELAEYTRIHFAVEESLMRILNFPGYEEHHDQHEALTQQLADLQAKIASGKRAIGFELMHFLKTWLSRHIMEEDMQYSGFFLASGAEPHHAERSWAQRLWSTITG